MTQDNIETNRKLQYPIPRSVKLEEQYDTFLSTGTVNGFREIEDWKDYLKKNITVRAENLYDPAVYYFNNLPQAIGLSKSSGYDLFWRSYTHINIDTQARDLLTSSNNKVAAREGIAILNLIQEQLTLYDFVDLAPITGFQLENGSLGLEWVVGRFRVGFNFEIDPNESGYFLISDRSAGEIRNYGYLKGLNRRSLVKSLLTLILES